MYVGSFLIAPILNNSRVSCFTFFPLPFHIFFQRNIFLSIFAALFLSFMLLLSYFFFISIAGSAGGGAVVIVFDVVRQRAHPYVRFTDNETKKKQTFLFSKKEILGIAPPMCDIQYSVGVPTDKFNSNCSFLFFFFKKNTFHFFLTAIGVISPNSLF